jgi:hypothetical protein
MYIYSLVCEHVDIMPYAFQTRNYMLFDQGHLYVVKVHSKQCLKVRVTMAASVV